MPSLSKNTIERNLLKKGFIKIEKKDHRFYYLTINGKRACSRTKISRGSHYNEYDISLLKKMKLQLQLNSIAELKDLLTCPMTKETYLRILRDKEIIN